MERIVTADARGAQESSRPQLYLVTGLNARGFVLFCAEAVMAGVVSAGRWAVTAAYRAKRESSRD